MVSPSLSTLRARKGAMYFPLRAASLKWLSRLTFPVLRSACQSYWRRPSCMATIRAFSSVGETVTQSMLPSLVTTGRDWPRASMQ